MSPKTPSPNKRGPVRQARVLNLVLFVPLVAIALLAILWLAQRGDDQDPTTPDSAADALGVEHVHGLGLNPADGSLIVATHYGSFRIPEGGDAERIGDSLQDTMGFTVIGADRFLGSGHPDVEGLNRGLPGQLGLIESDDAGVTWDKVSLSGQVDFHGLVSAHDLVYGWDSGSGRFMVSGDRREWETRSTLDLYGFAVDPDDADHIVGAAPDGPVESEDGGRNWDSVEGPGLVVLGWDAEVGLWGADAAGGTWHLTDGRWQQSGELPGQPQAFLATPEALYAAAFDDAEVTGIYRSTDDGRTWDLVYQDRPA